MEANEVAVVLCGADIGGVAVVVVAVGNVAVAGDVAVAAVVAGYGVVVVAAAVADDDVVEDVVVAAVAVARVVDTLGCQSAELGHDV